MFNFLKEKFRELRTGQKRIAPAGVRGRVYAGKDDSSPSNCKAKAQGISAVHAKIIRADGTEEDLGLIARGKQTQ